MEMVQVDAYALPADEADAYIALREECAKAATKVFQKYCAEVRREWAGSEDGEAITGYDANGQLQCLIHLDPYDLPIVAAAIQDGTVEKTLCDMNGLAMQK